MANDLNQVVLIGNCVRDVEISYTQGGMCIGKLSLASNRSVKRNNQWESEVSYFDVTIFGKTAENLQPYLLKGQKVAVSGILKQDRWEKDGHKFSKIGIIANIVQLIGSNPRSNGPWVRKIPWRMAWQPTPVFLPGESTWTRESGGLQGMGSQRVGHN